MARELGRGDLGRVISGARWLATHSGVHLVTLQGRRFNIKDQKREICNDRYWVSFFDVPFDPFLGPQVKNQRMSKLYPKQFSQVFAEPDINFIELKKTKRITQNIHI